MPCSNSQSTSGTHCYHNMHAMNSACWHVGPCPVKCCWCGEDQSAEHGSFYPKPFPSNPAAASYTPPVFAGWTCASCKVFVSVGTYHHCSYAYQRGPNAEPLQVRWNEVKSGGEAKGCTPTFVDTFGNTP